MLGEIKPKMHLAWIVLHKTGNPVGMLMRSALGELNKESTQHCKRILGLNAILRTQ